MRPTTTSFVQSPDCRLSPRRVETVSAPRPLPSRLHLAYVTDTYPPEVNGVALTAARAVEHLRARGHVVEVIRPRQAGEARAAEPDLLVPGMPIIVYPGMQMGLPALGTLLRRWRADPPQLLHIATEGPLGWSALLAARRCRIPVTSDYRTRFDRYSAHYGGAWLARFIDAYLRAFHNRAAATFVSTDALRAQLAARGYRNLLTVGRGVDTTLFSPARRSAALRASWGVGPDDLAFIYVGRLAPEKNLELAARAYQAVRARHPRARMIWVGDGPARARLQLAHPDHVFSGTQRGERLGEHYASGDVFLFPSMTETFGNVVLEALASGLAMIAFDDGAAAQHAKNGLDARLVPVGRGDAFVRAALEIAAAPMLRRRLAHRAPRAVAPLAWPNILAGFENHLAAYAAPRSIRRHASR